VAEGTRLLSEYGVNTPSRVRIPPSPFTSGAAHIVIPAAAPQLPVPTSAVPPAQSIVVQTRPYEAEGVRRDAGSFHVLAIGWYSNPAEPFVYLVFDRMSHDIFWVAHSMVERVVSGAGTTHR
jgi:hypothetical protein